MNQLAYRVRLSRSGATRLIDRLVADGLVLRSVCTTDARGAEAVLTEQGRVRLGEAMPTHVRGVERYFLDAVDPMDRDALERTLGAVIAHGFGDSTDAECGADDEREGVSS